MTRLESPLITQFKFQQVTRFEPPLITRLEF